jgi:hypothetical protein
VFFQGEWRLDDDLSNSDEVKNNFWWRNKQTAEFQDFKVLEVRLERSIGVSQFNLKATIAEHSMAMGNLNKS